MNIDLTKRIDLTKVHSLRDIGMHMLQPPVDTITHKADGDPKLISLRTLLKRHRFAPGETPSFKEITRRWHPNTGTKAIHTLYYNTYLMGHLSVDVFKTLDELLPSDLEVWLGSLVSAIPGVGLLGGALVGLTVKGAREALDAVEEELDNIDLPAKPALEARTLEIGAMLAKEQFDLATLVEVWSMSERNRVVMAILANNGSVKKRVDGPLPKDNDAGSGLLTIGLTVTSKGQMFHPYSKDSKGSANQDADYYSTKGVLFTTIPLEFGTIDLYSTHLYNGNDLPEVPPLTSKPGVHDRAKWRRRQISELREFIKATHTPSHIAVLMGDFNVDEYHHHLYLEYESMERLAEDLDMEDAWISQFKAIGGDVVMPRGGTSPAKSDSEAVDDGSRIDYVFIEKPKPQHAFNIDVTRIRLMDFPRATNAPWYDLIDTMSDHRGIAFSLLCSPKASP